MGVLEAAAEKAKELLGIGRGDEDPEWQEAGRLFSAYDKEAGAGRWWSVKPASLKAGEAILAAPPGVQIKVLLRTFDTNWSNGRSLDSLRGALLAKNLPFTVADLEELVGLASREIMLISRWVSATRQVKRYVEAGNSLTPAMRSGLQRMKGAPTEHPDDSDEAAAAYEWMSRLPDGRKALALIDELLDEEQAGALPDAGEGWADLAIADIAALPLAEQTAWRRLVAHLKTAEEAKPTRQWRKQADTLLDAIGRDAFRALVCRWLNAVTLPPLTHHSQEHGVQTYTWVTPGGTEPNKTVLRGLAWCCAGFGEPEVARAVGHMAEAAMRKIRGTGAWAPRAAAGAIWALSEMPCDEAVAHLSRLKLKIAHRPTLGQIDRAIEAVAKRQGMSRDDVEDLAVPTYGLNADGVGRVEMGECAAELRVSPSGVALAWYGPGGKPVKSVPAEAKRDHADAVKGLKADAAAADQMYSAQARRLESFLFAERAWTVATLRERYFAHPILGALARRLVWHLRDGNNRGEGVWDAAANGFIGCDGAPLGWVTGAAEARLWHPLGFPTAAVLAWREFLEARQIRQPFKQAHREVYLLTDAEINTATYSNRFAGHVLKQHQFHQLAVLRGWRYLLQGGWDGGGDGNATLDLPRWNLRAEFWAEPADVQGPNISDSGVALYVATDQVRFCRLDTRERLPLTEVPALPFSEVMRDVDLFVGVASVGNDPTWRDRGEDGLRGYWEQYAFGDLSASAKTRAEVLERLLPRLKIAPRCCIDGRFLVVRGDIRTYKIHLGSGNILMEPNDQYLCIVQDRASSAPDGGSLFLPFEGDQRLSLILSKAFLLTDDKKITDKTILSQLGRGV